MQLVCVGVVLKIGLQFNSRQSPAAACAERLWVDAACELVEHVIELQQRTVLRTAVVAVGGVEGIAGVVPPGLREAHSLQAGSSRGAGVVCLLQWATSPLLLGCAIISRAAGLVAAGSCLSWQTLGGLHVCAYAGRSSSALLYTIYST
jgi:hypothetical protein